VHFTAETWRLLALNTVKNYFARWGTPVHGRGNDDKAMKLTEGKTKIGVVSNFADRGHHNM
jgi:hypothetical protein